MLECKHLAPNVVDAFVENQRPRANFHLSEIEDLSNAISAVRRQLLNSSESYWGSTPQWLIFRGQILHLFGRNGLEVFLKRLDITNGGKNSDEYY